VKATEVKVANGKQPIQEVKVPIAPKLETFSVRHLLSEWPPVVHVEMQGQFYVKHRPLVSDTPLLARHFLAPRAEKQGSSTLRSSRNIALLCQSLVKILSEGLIYAILNTPSKLHFNYLETIFAFLI